jgi:hypothetical protein
MDLERAMTPVRAGDRAFTWAVPDGWQQGKGAFGGLVAGALIGACEAVLADPSRPLRALTLEIMAPVVVGDAAIEVTPLRAGSSVTVVSGVLRQGGSVAAHAVATFGKDRDPAQWQALEPPRLPPPEEVPVAPVAGPPAPVFTRLMEYRAVSGLPFSGAAAGHEITGWVRPREPGRARGAGYLAACVDAYWPVALLGLTAPRPMATLTFTLMIVSDLTGVAPDAPLAYRARALAAGGGYIPEYRELWSPDGRLLALNPQTFALSR